MTSTSGSRRTRGIGSLVFSFVALVGLASCEKKEAMDPYFFLNPRLPIAAPINTDRAGAVFIQSFWVLPEDGTLRVRNFFIGLRVPISNVAGNAADATNRLLADDVPIKVLLKKVENQTETAVQLLQAPLLNERQELIFAPLQNDIAVKREITNGDADLYMKKGLMVDGTRYVEIEFASLRDPQPGLYRVEVQLLKDNAGLVGLATELVVSNYYKGK